MSSQSKIDIPDDIVDIIFDYKKQFDLIDLTNELKKLKTLCVNCDNCKICLYNCIECKEHICYECRYKDLNAEIVDENDFELFYKCDECDRNRYFYDITENTDEYDSEYDYYNEDRYARTWADCF